LPRPLGRGILKVINLALAKTKNLLKEILAKANTTLHNYHDLKVVAI